MTLLSTFPTDTALSSDGLGRKHKIRLTISLTSFRHPLLMKLLNESHASDYSDIFSEMAEAGLRQRIGQIVPTYVPQSPLPEAGQVIKVSRSPAAATPQRTGLGEASEADPMLRMGFGAADLHSFLMPPDPQ